MKKILGCAFVVIAAMALGGCETTRAKTAPSASFSFTATEKRVAVIEPDVHLGELTASGMVEPRADWTDSARKHIARNIDTILDQRGIDTIHIDSLTNPQQIQLSRLHSVVGMAIVRHFYMEGAKLPNKGSALDWTLGKGTMSLREEYGADYGLFLFVQDSYSSSGRVALMIGAALLGVGVQGGQQTAFASLVDLRTGNIVWFNILNNATGDLRTAEPAKIAVSNLIKEMPL